MASRRASFSQRLRNGLQVRWQRLATRQQIPEFQRRVKEIAAAHLRANAIVLFPPGLGWRTHLFQRPQQLALALAKSGALVFYQEPELSGEPPGLQPLRDSLYLCRVPVQTFQVLTQPLVSCMTWNRKYLHGLPPHRLHYDFVDDLAAFDGNPTRLRANHHWLLKTADLVTATAERLHAQVFNRRPDALLLPNGVDYDHFSRSRAVPAPTPPADLAPLVVQGKPIIGYYGALSRWFDFDLLAQVAAYRPNYAFVLIGPDFDGSLHPSGVLQKPNVHWLGRKEYSQLPTYLAHFTAAVIPFKLEALTHATSPLKLFEYMAGGKPVVATPMAESTRFPGVLTAASPTEFAEQLDVAVVLRQDPQYLALIDQIAQENTWTARAESLLAQFSDGSRG